MRSYASSLLLLLSLFLGGTVQAAERTSNLRHNDRSGRSTKSDECSIFVVEKPVEATFECEMDPADVNGEVGVRRALKTTARQTKELKTMLARGQIVSGEMVLVHEVGASFDDEHLHVPPGLKMKVKVMGRGERRLAKEMFPAVAVYADSDGGGGKGGGGGEGGGNGGDDNGGEKGGDGGAGLHSYIIEFTDKDVGPAAKCDAIANRKGANGKGERVEHVYTKTLNGCNVMLSETDAEELVNDLNVALVEPDGTVHASEASSQVPWGLDRINQMYGTDGRADKLDASSVKVYILDTGIRATHDDFSGGMLNKHSSCHASFVTLDDQESGHSDGMEFEDGFNHGTHVASIACGNNYGVSRCGELCSVKVLDNNGRGSRSWIIAGIEHVENDCQQDELCVLAAGFSAVNNTAMNDAVESTVSDGIVVVVSAGNEASNACGYSPSSAESAITVGATTNGCRSDYGDRLFSQDSISYFSNYGSCVDVFAPGQKIDAASAAGDSYDNMMSGTSMAVPHVAGIAAAVRHSSPDLNPAGVMARIAATSTAVGVHPGTPGVGIATTFAVNPDAMDHDATETHFQSPISNCIGMKAEINVVTDDWPWETSLMIKSTCSDSDYIFANGGQEYKPFCRKNHNYTMSVCLPPGQAYDFTISDPDGLCYGCGKGAYTLKVDGVELLSGGEFIGSETTSFGSCDPPCPEGEVKCDRMEMNGHSYCTAACCDLETEDTCLDVTETPRWCAPLSDGGCKSECEGANPPFCGCDIVRQADYRGTISTAPNPAGGTYTCQLWDRQFPHKHSRTSANFPGKGLEGGHNYCRNPDNEPGGAWCYTTDPSKRWAYCTDVPSCVPPTDPMESTTTERADGGQMDPITMLIYDKGTHEEISSLQELEMQQKKLLADDESPTREMLAIMEHKETELVLAIKHRERNVKGSKDMQANVFAAFVQAKGTRMDIHHFHSLEKELLVNAEAPMNSAKVLAIEQEQIKLIRAIKFREEKRFKHALEKNDILWKLRNVGTQLGF